ncbi:MAG TPA: phosphotransferase [Candidatus Limnocylindria bacterium]|nr:phosphotransferase [Candidatus Limnocylindria bacterium]
MPLPDLEGDRAAELHDAVSRVLRRPVTRVRGVRREELDYDAFLAGRSVSRIRGTAVVDGAEASWSFIEKVTEAPRVASAYLYDNGAREFAAYRSGLLEDLAPGLVAPAALRTHRSAGGTLTVWIEDLTGGDRRPLTGAELLTAARHLGRMAGRWRGRVPDDPWLFRGWVERHSQPEAVASGLAMLDGEAARTEVESRLGRSLEDARLLITDQPAIAAAMASLPQTLCHHDAVAANVFARVRDGLPETVLIDWESIGPGPAGADLASLLFSSARRGDFGAEIVPALLPAALEAYADGIAEMGNRIDPSELRLGVFAAIALRWTLVRDVVRVLLGASTARRGSAPAESPAQALDELIALTAVLFEAATHTRALLRRT